MPLVTAPAAVTIDDGLTALVVTAAQVALAVLLLRTALALLLAGAARLTDRHRPGSRRAHRLRLVAVRLGPRLARSAVVAVAGAGLLLPATAQAAPTSHPVRPPVLDRVVPASDLLADTLLGGTASWRSDESYRVRPGDTLWSIAERGLRTGHRPERAGDPAEVDRAWRRWYAANRSVIGPDPDVLHPGLELVPPRVG